MYTLANNDLTVEILDPTGNVDQLGSRYCTGGYIYQIKDNMLGNLLTGPKYPNPDVDVFDGQGAPEVFVTAPNSENSKTGGDVLVIGVGLVTRTSPIDPFHARNNPLVRKFCEWEVTQLPGKISMVTTQSIENIRIKLTRTILLHNRRLTSATMLQNNSNKTIPLNWFAHPFFPVPADNKLHLFRNTVEIPDNSGYYIDNKGIIARKSNYDWEKGLYQLISLKNKALFAVKQFHPLLGKLQISVDFIPDALALWGNEKTCSFEPFITKQIAPNQTFSWNITYSF